MSLFSFFNKKKVSEKEYNINLSLIKTDIHSHLLPGIDDGSKNMEESIAMILELKKLGFEQLICTPHVMFGYYQNSTEKIIKSFESLKQELAIRKIDIQLGVSAEYNFDEELLIRLEANDIISFGNSDYQYLLFEFSYFNEPNGIDSLIKNIFEKGYIPVLAHPERYPYFAQNKDKYVDLKNKGVLFQLNINSLTGMYSIGAKQIAEWLIANDYIEFIGSDVHKIEHVHTLNNAFKLNNLHELVDSGRLMNSGIKI